MSNLYKEGLSHRLYDSYVVINVRVIIRVIGVSAPRTHIITD
nr:MAG TPA: hypothetical protein [Caudoviricetes sp.]